MAQRIGEGKAGDGGKQCEETGIGQRVQFLREFVDFLQCNGGVQGGFRQNPVFVD